MKWNQGIRVSKMIKNKGMVLFIVLAIVALMTITTVSFTGVLKQDIQLINGVKTGEQAMDLAEAGINHAFAKINKDGFSAMSGFSGSLSTGTYSVRFVQTSAAGRILIVSTGKAGGLSRTVSVEIANKFPSSLLKIFGGGNDVKVRAMGRDSSVIIIGDIHANNGVELRAQGRNGFVIITGDVSATGIVQEGSQHYNADNLDSRVFINGLNGDRASITEEAARIVFPAFPYEKWKQEAIDADNYYDSSQTFSGTLSPSNGLIYVDGSVTIDGSCTLNGGIIANDITINGTFEQRKSGDRNAIIAKQGDIAISGNFKTQEAIVYAKRDLLARGAANFVDINGIMLAERDISFWEVSTIVIYRYILTYPSDLIGTSETEKVEIISWNR